ncbi:MAG: hypothetical protein ACYS99_21910, partial [Planctomycetota bacterium]
LSGCREPVDPEPEAAPILRPADYLPFAAGTRWTYEFFEGDRTLRIETVREGGDVRGLEGEGRVRFDFVYGSFEELESATKSIYAMPASGPREFYLDAFMWRIYHEPPIPLLPEEVRPAAEWTWSGQLEIEDFEGRASARLTLGGPEEVVVPAGTYSAVRVRAVYDPADLVITRWYARGVGLVKLAVVLGTEAEAGVRRGARLLAYSKPSN